MKNLFAFIVVGAAVVMVYFLTKSKTTTDKPDNKIVGGDCASLPPALRTLCEASKNTPTTDINAAVPGKKTGGFFNKETGIEWGSFKKPDSALNVGQYDSHTVNVGSALGTHMETISGFAGNGALELFTGNSALEYFTGVAQGAPAKKPSCLSIWQWNISHPNGPTFPMTAGINCKNSTSIL